MAGLLGKSKPGRVAEWGVWLGAAMGKVILCVADVLAPESVSNIETSTAMRTERPKQVLPVAVCLLISSQPASDLVRRMH